MATIQKRGNAYRIKVSCGYDVNGKQVIQSITWKPEAGMSQRQTEKELNKKAVLFEQDCLKGQVTAAVKFEMLAEEWFDAYAKTNLKATTYERYLQLKSRVYSAIGHLRLDKVTTRNIQLFINSLSQDGVNEFTGKPLSPKTIRLYKGFISNVFNYAIKMGMLTDNPCSRVTLPKLNKKEKQIYTMDETTRFISLLQNEPLKYRVFFNLAIYSGFRRGELLGLEWRDIDWQNSTIRISRTSNYTPQKGTFTDTTKTARSKRSMKFPPLIMDMLRVYKAEQDEEREKMGDLWEDHDRVFVGQTGRPLTTSLPYKWLGKFCKKHELPCYGVHHYRHLFASLLFKEGMDIVSVSGALGHTNPNVTLSVYCHEFQGTRDKVSDAVANALDFSKVSKSVKTQKNPS